VCGLCGSKTIVAGNGLVKVTKLKSMLEKAQWNWYSCIDARATGLVVAVRAINVFFSLSLVLFGILNLLFVHGGKANRYSIMVMLAATCILRVTRLVFQLIY
jgi:hypothetical protein